MQTNKKLVFLMVPAISVLLFAGCSALKKREPHTALTDLEQKPPTGAVARRFKESAPKGPTAVQSAIELSEKYARLSQEAAVLRQKNQDFIVENRRLRDQAAVLEAQLQQTQKELTESNGLLREMLVELNNWKTNVIGFREEMRGAEKAQLQALLKILEVLGGEVKQEPLRAEDESSTAVVVRASDGFQSPQTTTPGEPNE